MVKQSPFSTVATTSMPAAADDEQVRLSSTEAKTSSHSLSSKFELCALYWGIRSCFTRIRQVGTGFLRSAIQSIPLFPQTYVYKKMKKKKKKKGYIRLGSKGILLPASHEAFCEREKWEFPAGINYAGKDVPVDGMSIEGDRYLGRDEKQGENVRDTTYGSRPSVPTNLTSRSLLGPGLT